MQVKSPTLNPKHADVDVCGCWELSAVQRHNATQVLAILVAPWCKLLERYMYLQYGLLFIANIVRLDPHIKTSVHKFGEPGIRVVVYSPESTRGSARPPGIPGSPRFERYARCSMVGWIYAQISAYRVTIGIRVIPYRSRDGLLAPHC